MGDDGADPARLLVAKVAQELLDDSDVLAAGLADRIHRETPDLPGDEEFRQGTLEAGLRNVGQLTLRLRDGGDLSHFEPPAVAISYAQEYVHRGLELPVLLGIIRIGYAVFAREWSQRLRDSGAPAEVVAEAMGTSLLDIFTYIDAISGALSAAYVDERERWSRSLDATRMDLAQTILDGGAVEPASTERRLNHRLDGPQRAFLVWSDAEHTSGLRAALQTVAQQVAEAAGASHALLLPLGTKVLAGWIGGDAEEARWRALSATSLAPPETIAVNVAMGTTRQGVDGFRVSHEQAQLARRIARLRGSHPGAVTHYADVALPALATADLAQARAFVAHSLGMLAAPDAATRRIATTARIYLEEGRNRARTARRLGVHANTVAYRLARAEELLGHPLHEHAAAVEVALTIAPMVSDDD